MPNTSFKSVSISGAHLNQRRKAIIAQSLMDLLGDYLPEGVYIDVIESFGGLRIDLCRASGEASVVPVEGSADSVLPSQVPGTGLEDIPVGKTFSVDLPEGGVAHLENGDQVQSFPPQDPEAYDRARGDSDAGTSTTDTK